MDNKIIDKAAIEHLRFPVGRFIVPKEYSAELIKERIASIKNFPSKLGPLVQDLNQDELQLIYRPEGWNISQVVHHLADSHMNAYIRFKLALTEDKPMIKPYLQGLWASCSDSNSFPIESSIQILTGLHARFAQLLESMSTKDLDRVFVHPEWNKELPIKMNICLYAWHGEHHFAHINNALKYKGEFMI